MPKAFFSSPLVSWKCEENVGRLVCVDGRLCVLVSLFFFRGRRRRTCGGDEEEETQPTRLYGVVEPWRMFAFNRSVAWPSTLPFPGGYFRLPATAHRFFSFSLSRRRRIIKRFFWRFLRFSHRHARVIIIDHPSDWPSAWATRRERSLQRQWPCKKRVREDDRKSSERRGASENFNFKLRGRFVSFTRRHKPALFTSQVFNVTRFVDLKWKFECRGHSAST